MGLSKLSDLNFYHYNYSEPVGSLIKEDPLLMELCSSAAFQRLKDIRFLGSIDYWLIPSPNGARSNVRYTRYQHSLGVARLAALYSDLRELPSSRKKLATAAALLHDIGHGPFSHSAEQLFEREFGVNHHISTSKIIRGESKLGEGVKNILEKFDLDPDEVIEVINGQVDYFEGFFAGPINFDTIEGILRSREYISHHYVTPRPIDVLIAATQRSTTEDKNVVDAFWRYKHEIYNLMIRSPIGVLADHIIQEVLRRNMSKITEKFFYNTERQIMKHIPELVEALYNPRSAAKRFLNLSEAVSYTVRSFSINQQANFFDREDNNRYTQSKDVKMLQTYYIAAELAQKGGRNGNGNRASQKVFKY